MGYSEDLVKAVKYLYEKGLKTTEIAKRLDVSPFTVRNIISILNRRSKVKREEGNEHKEGKPDILSGLLEI